MFEKILLFEKKPSRIRSMTVAVFVEIFFISLLIFTPLFFKPNGLKEYVSLEQVFLPPQVPPGPKNPINTKKLASKNKLQPKKTEAPPQEVLQSPPTIPQDIVTEENTGNKGEPEKRETKGTEGGTGMTDGKPCDAPNCIPGGTREPDEKEKNPPPPPDPPRVGGNVKQANLIHRVEPIYPPLAKQNRVQGTVVLEAIIGIDGAIRDIKITSGHALLRQSAIDAVEQWKYEPATLNGEPIEVTTIITINFILKN